MLNSKVMLGINWVVTVNVVVVGGSVVSPLVGLVVPPVDSYYS